ncbi:MAG: hypothetical protein H7Y09_04730, partial [Chitinophagaceae bacterium]|nr:hypothetical protein [Anaerolineae bacterium]
MAQNVITSTDVDAPLTPRELRLERISTILRWGAILNALLVAIVITLTIISAASSNLELVRSIAQILLPRATSLREDAALLAVILLIFANISALLVSMVGVLAQELWSLVLIALTVIANAAGLILFGFLPGLLTVIVAAFAATVLIADLRAFRTNPVMLKELRERMRGARAFVVITVYLALMSGFAVLLYLVQRGVVQDAG